uniref:F-box domain-containing protein n=1 Tax=Quercus lobata TaxID=97700 RepID=A0A7N2LMZ1_QUELO
MGRRVSDVIFETDSISVSRALMDPANAKITIASLVAGTHSKLKEIRRGEADILPSQVQQRLEGRPFDCLRNKEQTTPRISLVNVQTLNYLLRSEIFVSEDSQLRAAPLILDYEPLSRTQQIFVAEEWAKKSREELNTEVQSRLAAEKAAGALRLEKERLSKEIKEAFKARDSVEAGLKTTAKLAEDMRQQLHLSEINLAIEKQMVSDLKAQLLQAKEAARLAREAAEAAVATSYERGVADTKARLTEEVAAVCRDYITMSWGVALDRAAVPVDSDLRKIENIFFLEDIREIPGSIPPEEPLFASTTTPDSLIPEEKGGNKEVQPPAKDKSPEDALTIRDVVAQAKEAGPKPTAGGDHPETEEIEEVSRSDPPIKLSKPIFFSSAATASLCFQIVYKKKTTKITTTFDDLPISLMLEILHRLDIKSVMLFKSVSKEWCSVVSVPSFARYFVNRSVLNYRHHH